MSLAPASLRTKHSAKPTGKTARVISQITAPIHAHGVTDWKAITIAYTEKVSWLFRYIWDIFVRSLWKEEHSTHLLQALTCQYPEEIFILWAANSNLS